MSSNPRPTVISVKSVSKSFSTPYLIEKAAFSMRWLKAGDPNAKIDNRGSTSVLQDVSFEVKQGERIGIIGPNGAGKSTLLRIISGITGPTTGTVDVVGSVGGIFEVSAGYQPNLSCIENVIINLTYQGFSRSEALSHVGRVFRVAELEGYEKAPFHTLSSGMKVRLGFISALLSRPDIAVLDEVLSVGDMRFRKRSLRLMHEYLRQRTVVMVSHSMEDILNVCRRVLVIQHGKVIFDGPSKPGIKLYERICNDTTPLTEEEILSSAHGVYVDPKSKIVAFRMTSDGNAVEQVEKGKKIKCGVDITRAPDAGKVCIMVVLRKIDEMGLESVLGTYRFDTHDENQKRLEWEFSTESLFPGKYLLEMKVISSGDAELVKAVFRRHTFTIVTPQAFSVFGSSLTDLGFTQGYWA